MDIDALITSYRRYLMATIQAREVGAFGGGLDKVFATAIAAHRQAEEDYVRDQLAARAQEITELRSISHK